LRVCICMHLCARCACVHDCAGVPDCACLLIECVRLFVCTVSTVLELRSSVADLQRTLASDRSDAKQLEAANEAIAASLRHELVTHAKMYVCKALPGPW
jgi:hypothetical protein